MLGDRGGLVDDFETLHFDIAQSFQGFRQTLSRRCSFSGKGLVEITFRLGNRLAFLDAQDVRFDQYEMIPPLVRLPLLQTCNGRKESPWCAVATWLESKSRRYSRSFGAHQPTAKAAQLVLLSASAWTWIIPTDFRFHTKKNFSRFSSERVFAGSPNGLTFSRKPREQTVENGNQAARGLAAATWCWAAFRFGILRLFHPRTNCFTAAARPSEIQVDRYHRLMTRSVGSDARTNSSSRPWQAIAWLCFSGAKKSM